MADLEDALSPTWANVVGGQAALHRRRARHAHVRVARGQGVPARRADRRTLVVRPRGWHLIESHVLVDDVPVSARPVRLRAVPVPQRAPSASRAGRGPYLYLPKLESHHEARLWNEVFIHAQAALGVPRGSIRATVLIETITAAFEMDEILYELREHAAGLNAGRWDYLFSVIKQFHASAGLRRRPIGRS